MRPSSAFGAANTVKHRAPESAFHVSIRDVSVIASSTFVVAS